jgi:hypothetical protein
MHMETIFLLKEMDRKALLAEAEQARLAKQAAAGTTWVQRPAGWAALRTVIGAGLMRIGLALQGAPAPALPTSPAAD